MKLDLLAASGWVAVFGRYIARSSELVELRHMFLLHRLSSFGLRCPKLFPFVHQHSITRLV